MAHEYKVGDKVRINERKGRAHDYPCSFVDEMTQHKGKIFTIKEILELPLGHPDCRCKFYNGDDHYYLFEEITYSWHSSMFELVTEDSETQISTSLEEGDLVPICGMIGKIEYYKCPEYSGYYLYFDDIINKQEHSACCEKLRELVPNFDKIADEYDPVQHEFECFPEFSTIDDLIKFTQAVNNAYHSKESITITKTSNENEIKFQRAKASSKRGIVPAGRAICGRRCKTAIKLGHLSNTTCHC